MVWVRVVTVWCYALVRVIVGLRLAVRVRPSSLRPFRVGFGLGTIWIFY